MKSSSSGCSSLENTARCFLNSQGILAVPFAFHLPGSGPDRNNSGRRNRKIPAAATFFGQRLW
jgi:hypothetical protein